MADIPAIETTVTTTNQLSVNARYVRIYTTISFSNIDMIIDYN